MRLKKLRYKLHFGLKDICKLERELRLSLYSFIDFEEFIPESELKIIRGSEFQNLVANILGEGTRLIDLDILDYECIIKYWNETAIEKPTEQHEFCLKFV